MTKASDNEFPKVILDVGSIPAAPTDGNWKLYGAAGGVYAVSSNATAGPFGAGGGAVATDAIWDAAGDLAVGSGANTAAKLTAGTEGHVLTIASGVPAWAAGGSSDLVLLATTTVAGSVAAAITFTGISAAYEDLVVVASLRSDKASTADDYRIRVGNGSIDSGANYAYVFTSSVVTTTTTNHGEAQTTVYFGPGASAGSPAGDFGYHEMRICDYANAAHFRQLVGTSVSLSTGGETTLAHVAGTWKNAAAAIDQVSVFADTGDLEIGSWVSIYGRG